MIALKQVFIIVLINGKMYFEKLLELMLKILLFDVIDLMLA
jgi:hypothetical protein